MELNNFCDIGNIRWKATNVLATLEVEEQHEDSTSFEFLNVHSSTYLPIGGLNLL
jgi:hypothetical protein